MMSTLSGAIIRHCLVNEKKYWISVLKVTMKCLAEKKTPIQFFVCEASFMEIFLHRYVGHWKIINFSRKIVKSGWLILRVQFPQYSFWCKGEFSMRMAYVVFYLSSGSSRSCTCFVRRHGTEESVSKLHRWTRKHFKLLACWNFKINSFHLSLVCSELVSVSDVNLHLW